MCRLFTSLLKGDFTSSVKLNELIRSVTAVQQISARVNLSPSVYKCMVGDVNHGLQFVA